MTNFLDIFERELRTQAEKTLKGPHDDTDKLRCYLLYDLANVVKRVNKNEQS